VVWVAVLTTLVTGADGLAAVAVVGALWVAALTALVTGAAGEPVAGTGAADFESAVSVPAADGAEIAGITWPAEIPEASCGAGFVEATAPLGTAKNANSKAAVAIQRASNLQISPTAVVMSPRSAK